MLLAKFRVSPACCEQVLFVAAGITTLVCGPGSLAQAHGPDEYIEIDQLEGALSWYKAMIREILG